MFTNLVYVCSFFITTFTLAFRLQHVEITQPLELAIDVIMLLDILSEFVTTRKVDGVLLESFEMIAP